MGAASKVCDDAMEAPRLTSSSASTPISDVPYSRLTVDTSLSLPEMTPRIMLVVSIPCSPFRSVPCYRSVFPRFWCFRLWFGLELLEDIAFCLSCSIYFLFSGQNLVCPVRFGGFCSLPDLCYRRRIWLCLLNSREQKMSSLWAEWSLFSTEVWEKKDRGCDWFQDVEVLSCHLHNDILLSSLLSFYISC